MYRLVGRNNRTLSHRLPQFSKQFKIGQPWLLERSSQHRHYYSLKGVFGNYQVNSCSEETLKLPDDGLPFSYQLVRNAFKQRGHLLCQLDPLCQTGRTLITADNLADQSFLKQVSHVLGVDLKRFLNESNSGTFVDQYDYLGELFSIYCGHVGYEFSHLDSLEEVTWFENVLQKEFQKRGTVLDYNIRDEGDLARMQESIAMRLFQTEALDHFLAKKFQSVKRYGCEGAETMVTFVEELVHRLTKAPCSQTYGQVNEIVIGMPHRGRINLLVNTLNYPPEALFHKLSGKSEFDIESGPGRTFAIGDVLSHLYTSAEFDSEHRPDKLQVTFLPNPSHLEVVGPVVCGYSRGQMLAKMSGPYYDGQQGGGYNSLPLQIHGDASFSGQGIIMETLALANIAHYSVAGSIHLIVNNQVGYTTPGRPQQARSSLYCSDPVKSIGAAVIHVNGEHPEQVAFAARLALSYRQKFCKDIAVNLYCFRRWGHNELDDPTFTNPNMYRIINNRQSIPVSYAKSIGLPDEKVTQTLSEYNERMNEAVSNSANYQPPKLPSLLTKWCSPWRDIGFVSNTSVTKWNTAVPKDVLKHLCQVSVTTPPDWNLHSTLKRVFKDRQSKVHSQVAIDWATAESLAFGSLLYQGHNVRISGQDVGRGTFSQRHAMIVDQQNGDVHIPLNNLSATDCSALSWKPSAQCKFGQLEICNSILSEEAVMAFEYGLSLSSPNTLPIWEAQFGDFFNGAQIIIDTLVSSGEAKWLLQSSLTLLLPHGYDGAGPEHTSARLERFLQGSNSSEHDVDSDNVNWTVAYPTTPGQYFHLLRRQQIRPYRKPLVVMSPKILLRHPRCVSFLEELSGASAHFKPVLDDPRFAVDHSVATTNTSVRSIIFCSGKHYYALEKEREDRQLHTVAIVRLEELCPFPVEDVAKVLQRYPKANKLIWSQEEHRNMGAWSFVQARFANILKQKLLYSGRGHLEAPAVGIGLVHHKEVKQLFDDTFGLCQS